MDEVVEVSVGALHLLARSPENRQTMRKLNTVKLFVQVCNTALYVGHPVYQVLNQLNQFTCFIGTLYTYKSGALRASAFVFVFLFAPVCYHECRLCTCEIGKSEAYNHRGSSRSKYLIAMLATGNGTPVTSWG